MSGSGKAITNSPGPVRADPQSEQVVRHLKDAKSGKRIGANLPLELYESHEKNESTFADAFTSDTDAPENVYLRHIQPSKTHDDMVALTDRKSGSDETAPRSPPVNGAAEPKV